VRDLLEHVEDPLVARVIRVRTEVEAGAGVATQGRGEATEELLCLDERDLLPVFGEVGAGCETTDAATDDDRVTQGDLRELGEFRGYPNPTASAVPD
jgi:hypothetical protein